MTAHLALPALGLIVLRVDETIEHEFRTLIPPSTARLHVTRINSGDDLTPETIAKMGDSLTRSAALLPMAANFDVVAYACTSGTALLGSDTVHARVQTGIKTRAVTDPLTAAVAAIKARGLCRVGLLSPYTPDVADGLVAAFAARGVEIAQTLSLEESEEAKVVRFGADMLAQAARDLTRQAPIDGLFISCTNLNTAALLAPLSDELGMPVLSSNQVLAENMMALSGA